MLIDEPTNHLDLHAIQWLANHKTAGQRWRPSFLVTRPLVLG